MKEKKNLTRRILEFFKNKPKAPLAELLKQYPAQIRSIYTIVHRLQKQGYLTKLKQKQGRDLKSYFQITTKTDEKFGVGEGRKDKVTKVWDGIWRLLVFDIPEEEKATREYLRQELKDRGFYMLQLSVWITPFEVDEELKSLIDEIGAKYYVRYMVVKEINYEADIMQHFGL